MKTDALPGPPELDNHVSSEQLPSHSATRHAVAVVSTSRVLRSSMVPFTHLCIVSKTSLALLLVVEMSTE